jgi:hypothetical protein
MDFPQSTSRHLSVAIAVAGGLLAALLRWYFVTHAQIFQPLDLPNVRADAVDYYRYAWNLAHHATFALDVPGSATLHPDSFRDPGYPALLSLWMLVTSSFDAWYAGVLVTHALLGGLTVLLLCLAFAGRMPNGWLAVVAVVAAIWPHSIAMSGYVLSENLLAFLVAFALACLRWSGAKPKGWRVAITGVAFSLAALTNAVMLPVGALVAAVLAWRRLMPRRAAMVLLAASLLLPLAWSVRNAGLETSSTSSHRAVINLVQGSWPTYHAAYQLAMKGDPIGKQTTDAINAEITSFDNGMGTGLANLAGRMAQTPLRMFAWYVSKPALLWGWDIRIGQGDIYVYPTRNSPFRTQAAWRAVEAACFLINPLLLVLAAVGAVFALVRQPLTIEAVGMATVLIVVTAIYAALQSEPRYSIPFRGPEIVLAALGCVAIIRWWRERPTTEASRATP